MRYFSQNGEDGILLSLIKILDVKDKVCVEIGVGDGTECNTRILTEFFGWKCYLFDGKPTSNNKIKNEFVTAENINKIIEKYKIPKKIGLLSIDIDGNDYWAWKAIKKIDPLIVVIEYNSTLGQSASKVIKYDSNFVKGNNNYFGASLSALEKLGKKKGYTLVACDSKGINAFFVKTELLKNHRFDKNYTQIYRPPRFGSKINGKYVGYGLSNKKLASV